MVPGLLRAGRRLAVRPLQTVAGGEVPCRGVLGGAVAPCPNFGRASIQAMTSAGTQATRLGPTRRRGGNRSRLM